MSFSGAIKSFNPQKGWGFIECPETQEIYGKDIFVLSSALPGGTANKGDPVNFDVAQGDHGPQGANIELLGARPAQNGRRLPVRSPKVLQGAGKASYIGRVKSFNAQKGWGFIESEQTFNLYGKDMFVLGGGLPGGTAQKGDEVIFNVVQTPTGPHAIDVQLVRTRPVAAAPVVPGPGPCRGPTPDELGADHIGVVKSFSSEKGWGFVTSPTLVQLYGKDIFFSKTSLLCGQVNVGDKVAFSVTPGDKGPMASNIQPFQLFPGAPQWAPPVQPPRQWSPASRPPMALPIQPATRRVEGAAQRFFGSVKKINEEKGWGHITCQAASQMYGKDVFLRRSDLELGLETGVLVSFRILEAAKGPQAQDVVVLPEGSFGVESQPGVLYNGTVKSFNEAKGWGFATSDDIQKLFGKDIFLHRRELNGTVPNAGDSIQFSVEQGPSGQLEAKNVALGAVEGYQAAPRPSGARPSAKGPAPY